MLLCSPAGDASPGPGAQASTERAQGCQILRRPVGIDLHLQGQATRAGFLQRHLGSALASPSSPAIPSARPSAAKAAWASAVVGLFASARHGLVLGLEHPLLLLELILLALQVLSERV